jgi:outer membrane protein OmpA-like peptidoglycan-associated protein
MRTWFVIGTLGLGLAGCAKPVTFQGQTTLAVVGTPPPPPVAEVKAPPRVEIRDNKIAIGEKIQFEYDKATIMEASFGLMNEIADVIAKNPQIKQLRIEGYASAEGDAAHNKALSDARARSVMKYLTGKGIAAGTLVAMGFGIDKPIADNATEDGREKNRRVEFVILEQDVTKKTVEIDPATGAEKVIAEDKKTIMAPAAEANAKKPPIAPKKGG